MPRSVFALLVGIDEYPAPVNPLRGCVNDIRRMEELLAERVSGEDIIFAALVLTNGEATRQRIMDAFRTHLGQAGPGDVVLFYYSGHGSQQPSPPEFWKLEPDRLDETLVCYDSRLPGSWDLADKELAQLIVEVASNDPHIIVILDCCHSGSGTRDLNMPEEGVTIRRVPTDDRIRPIDSFAVTLQQAEALQPSVTGRGGQGGGWYSLPVGRHVVLSACSTQEEAKELYLGGEQRGAFSYYLLDTLRRTGEPPSYRDLFKRVNAQVRLRVSGQSPQMEATRPEDLSQPFLGGAVRAGSAYFTASYDPDRGWVIDGGAVHGIPAPNNGETTYLALFPMDARIDQLDDLSDAVGSASVTQVFPGQSRVNIELQDPAAPDLGSTYKAVVTALPLPPLLVSLEGDEDALGLLRNALDHAGPDGAPSLLVRIGNHEEAEFYIQAADDRYRIRRKGDEYALTVDTERFSEESAALTVQRLEHIARWMRIGELHNPSPRLASDAVRMEVFVPTEDREWQPASEGSNIYLEYMRVGGRWQQPVFKVKLTNTSSRPLYCMLFDLPETYGVTPILPGGGEWLEPGQETWGNQGNPYFAEVRESLWEAGVIEFRDMLKLVFTTDQSDGNLWAQADLPVVVSKAIARSTPLHMNSLNQLMSRVPTRDINATPADDEAFADWNADEISLTIVRPLETTQIRAAGDPARLGHGVSIGAHSELQAQASLSDLPQVSRDAGNVALPPLIRDHPDLFKPFEFTVSRSGEPGLSVLHLSGVRNFEAVTPEAPLVVKIDRPLADDEALLAVGFDGEFYLPAGYARRQKEGTEVVIERLPAPTSRGTRDLAGAIRILFQKVIGQRVGLDFPYPVLAVADVAESGEVTYQPAADAVATAVAAADRILLYVHGIIGETRSMVISARTGSLGLISPPPSLADRYDVILTFDYESINTSIEETARDLRQRLTDVGLGPDHGKTLHVFAHSMGGLVSRWFIEREEGHRVVQHLVLAGTPNDGSPWPTVQDWALTALAIGLNSLSAVAWPVKVLGALVKATEAIDVALDEMNPHSDFLKTLAGSADPGVPYTIIAGNTSIIPAAKEPESGESESRLARLWNRIKKRNWVHAGASLAFYHQPNDMAVSVASTRSVSVNRTPRPIAVEVACDHLTYFSSEAGLQALADAVEVGAVGQQ